MSNYFCTLESAVCVYNNKCAWTFSRLAGSVEADVTGAWRKALASGVQVEWRQPRAAGGALEAAHTWSKGDRVEVAELAERIPSRHCARAGPKDACRTGTR